MSKASSIRFVPASLDAMDALDVDTLVVLLLEDQRPLLGAAGLLDWRLVGWVNAQLLGGNVTGKKGERVLTHTLGRLPVARVVLMGMGPTQGADLRLPDVLVDAGRVLEKAGAVSAALGACLPATVVHKAVEQAPANLRDRLRVVLDLAPDAP